MQVRITPHQTAIRWLIWCGIWQN